jgi:hypothetical protein
MSHSPCGPNGTKWRRIAPLNRRLGQLELYSKKYTVSPIRGSWMAPLLAPSSAKICRERSARKTLSADSIAQGSRRNPPDGGRLNLCRTDFRFLISSEQRWHRRPDAAQGADHCRQPPL